MISEFRKMKLLYLYYAFFDTNSSGTVDKEDFELAIENIAKLRGWKNTDSKYKDTQTALLKIWDLIKQNADINKDGEVTAQEWLQMWEQYASNSKPLEWQELFCKFIFDLEDENGDGAINCEEYSEVIESLGLLKEDALAAFEKMSKGNAIVSWEEFKDLWAQYLTSENPKDPGNFILGAATY